MANILEHFDFSNVYSVVGWLIIVYAMVLGSMAVDLVCGLYKAVKAGKATTSTGLKKTCTKAGQYFLPLMCLSLADVMASAFMSVPPFTMVYGAFCIICEFKSVFENTHTKQQIADANSTVNLIIKNKDDIAHLLVDVLQQMNDENNKDK